MPCQFSHGRELGISMYGEWGEKHAHSDFCGSLWNSGTILRQIQALDRSLENVLKLVSIIVRRTNAEQRYHQWGQLTHFHCTIARRGPPHLSGSHVSYVSIADVRKIWQCPSTPNPHVHKVDGPLAYHF